MAPDKLLRHADFRCEQIREAMEQCSRRIQSEQSPYWRAILERVHADAERRLEKLRQCREEFMRGTLGADKDLLTAIA
ncbi:hypothetical protein [Acidovorax phage AP1]|nr:hypothetical protein [Acidovorax phage AP1]